MTEEGFFRTKTRGICGLCGRLYYADAWIRRMPDQWSPENPARNAHQHCVYRLINQIALDHGVEIVLTRP